MDVLHHHSTISPPTGNKKEGWLYPSSLYSLWPYLFCLSRSDDMCKLIAGNSVRLFSIFDIDWHPQRINIFLSPHRIMLLLQVGVIVRGFDFMLSDSGKESTSTDVQPMHGLLCCQQFIITPCHNKSPLRMFVFYTVDIQLVKSYNMFKATNQLSHSTLLMTLYTKVVVVDNLDKVYKVASTRGQKKEAIISLNSVVTAYLLPECDQQPRSRLSSSRRLTLILPDFTSQSQGKQSCKRLGLEGIYE